MYGLESRLEPDFCLPCWGREQAAMGVGQRRGPPPRTGEGTFSGWGGAGKKGWMFALGWREAEIWEGGCVHWMTRSRIERRNSLGEKAAKQRGQSAGSSPCGVRSPLAPWKTRSGEDSEAGAKLSVTGGACRGGRCVTKPEGRVAERQLHGSAPALAALLRGAESSAPTRTGSQRSSPSREVRICSLKSLALWGLSAHPAGGWVVTEHSGAETGEVGGLGEGELVEFLGALCSSEVGGLVRPWRSRGGADSYSVAPGCARSCDLGRRRCWGPRSARCVGASEGVSAHSAASEVPQEGAWPAVILGRKAVRQHELVVCAERWWGSGGPRGAVSGGACVFRTAPGGSPRALSPDHPAPGCALLPARGCWRPGLGFQPRSLPCVRSRGWPVADWKFCRGLLQFRGIKYNRILFSMFLHRVLHIESLSLFR